MNTSTLIVCGLAYVVLSGLLAIALLRMARRTSEDWEEFEARMDVYERQQFHMSQRTDAPHERPEEAGVGSTPAHIGHA